VAIFGILVIIFVGYSSGRYLAYAVDGLLQVDTIVSFILLKAAIALEVLLPVALYLSIILGLGRMDTDLEITAIRACGIGFRRVLGVVLMLSLALAVVVGLISLYGRPVAYQKSYWIKAQAEAEIDLNKLQSASFYDSENRERTIFVDQVDEATQRFTRVFIRDVRNGIVNIVYARDGEQRFDAASGKRSLVLWDVHVYFLALNGPRDRGVGKFGQLTIRLHDAQPISVGYKRKAASTLQLASSDVPEDIAEFQWRLSTPISTVLLGVLAAFLSRAAYRRSRYTKTLAALVIYAIYYNMTAMAKTWVESDVVGAFPGIWWVQALLAAILLAVLLQPRWSSNRSADVAS
jgi:lipopolysaccharide export system permease protein